MTQTKAKLTCLDAQSADCAFHLLGHFLNCQSASNCKPNDTNPTAF